MSEKGLRLRIVTRLGERCTAVPLQVQDSDNTKLEVHGLFKKSDKTRREVLQSHCGCKKTMNLSRRFTSVWAQSNDSTKSKMFRQC